jgi:hypothetical protein
MASVLFRSVWVALACLVTIPLAAEITTERSVGLARIRHIEPLPATDLVVLDNGFEAGFRQGMVCSVSRSGENLGQLLLVDLRDRTASALILDLTPGYRLQVGDTVTVKTVSSRN